MSCSMSYAEHTASNNDKPIAEGDRSTKSSSYTRWLINVVGYRAANFYIIYLITQITNVDTEKRHRENTSLTPKPLDIMDIKLLHRT